MGGDQTPIVRGSALGGPGNQKKWLPANFRPRLGDLPTANARVIQPFSVSVAVADLDGDGSPERVVQASPITFEVPPGDAAAFRDAFQKSVDGEPVYQNLELEVFNGDASVIALKAEVTVSGIGPVDPLAEPGEGAFAVTVKGSNPIKKGHVTLIK